MAVFNLILTSLTAFLTYFLSFSPTALHGLAPWIHTLSTRPVAPILPSASPQPFFIRDFWEEIPMVNLSSAAPIVSAPSPTPTVVLVAHEEKDEQRFESPMPEERTTNELLRELGFLLGQVILCLTANTNDLIMKYPFIRSPRTNRRICKFRLPAPRRSPYHSRRCCFPWSRVRSPAPPSAPAPAPAPAPDVAPSSPAATPLPPSLPSAFTSPAPLEFLPPASPSPLALPPAFLRPPTLSEQAPPPPPTSPASSAFQVQSPPSLSSESSSSTEQTRRPPIVERLRRDIERREQQNRIRELEQTVKDLTLQLAETETRRCDPVTVLNPSAPSFSPPQPPQAAAVQPVVSAGSAYIPPHQRFGFGHNPPPPQPSNIQYPRPPHPSNPPNGYGQPLPSQPSLDDFFKRFPKTGKKEPGWGN